VTKWADRTTNVSTNGGHWRDVAVEVARGYTRRSGLN